MTCLLQRAVVGHPFYLLLIILALYFMTSNVRGQEKSVHPLQPLDRSSLHATLKNFLEAIDTVGEIMAQEYLTSPSRAAFNRRISQGKEAIRCLDLRNAVSELLATANATDMQNRSLFTPGFSGCI